MTDMRPEDVRALVRAGAMFLAAGVAARALDWIFSGRPILAVVIGAFLLDVWAQRIGARWMPPGPGNERSLSAKRLLTGVARGLALGLSIVIVLAVVGAAQVSATQVSATSVAIGVARTAAYAFRDELLFRGVPLALMNGHVPRSWSIAFCAALGIAPILLSEGGFAPIVLTASTSLFFATIWQLGEGGFAAWATHAGWRIAIEVVFGGSVLAVTYAKGALPSTDGAAGLPAYVGAAAFALASASLLRRTK